MSNSSWRESLRKFSPLPLAAFRNNPANRNASRRRVALLYNSNRREREKVKALQASIMKHKPNLVQQAQAELNAQEQNGLTPIPPTPQPVSAASNRALAAAQVPLPRNQNNVVAAQRKAAREQPNIWNMNQDRSLFQLGPERVAKSPVLSPPVLSPPVLSPSVLSPSVQPTVQPVSFVQSASRRNRRRHNTTPGLARAQLRKREKLHAQLQRKAQLERNEAARKAAMLANNGLGNNPFNGINSSLLEQTKVRNTRRLENNAKRANRAKEKLDAFVSPVGLYGNDTFVENLGSNQNIIMSNRGTRARLQQELRDRGSIPVANAAKRAAIVANPAVAARLAEKASLAPKFPEGGPRAEISPEVRARQEAEALAAFLAAKPANNASAAKPANNASAANWLAYYRSQGLRNNNSRIQALLREREREEPAGSINSFVAPGSANSFLNNPEPVVPLSPKIPAGFNARRPLGAPPSLFPPTHARPAGLSPRVQAAIEQGLPNREPRRWNGANITANAQKRLNNNAERRGKLRNSIKAMKASRNANAAREAALRGVRTSTVNNSPAVSNAVVAAQLERNSVTNQEARAAAKERVERFKLGLNTPKSVRNSAAANTAAAAAAAAASAAAFAKSAEGPDVYGCTPCDRKILDKLDMLLDRSKPSNVLGALKGTGAFVVTQVAAALADAEAALKLAQERGSKVAKKVAENALKYAKKKLEQLLKVTTLNPETKEKIKMALAKIRDALELLAKTTGLIIGGTTLVAVIVAVGSAAAIIGGLALAGSKTFEYLKTVAVPAATAAWSAAKAKILSGLGLAASWMNSTRKSLGKRLYNFGTRVSGAAAAAYAAAGRGADAVSRAMYRLSGREQSDMIKILVQKVTSLELQGRITSKALEELNAALAVAKPGVVTADVVEEAAKVGADKGLLANAAALPRLANAAALPRLANETPRGSLVEVERRNPPLAESPIQVINEAPRPLQTRGVAAPPGEPLISPMNGGKRSRKNRKSSRKNRKASRRNRK